MSRVPSTQPSEAAMLMRYDANKKSTMVAYLLWFFLGGVGAHRFYLGCNVSGGMMLGLLLLSALLMLVVIGVFGFFMLGLWILLDAVLIPGMAQAYNNRLIETLR